MIKNIFHPVDRARMFKRKKVEHLRRFFNNPQFIDTIKPNHILLCYSEYSKDTGNPSWEFFSYSIMVIQLCAIQPYGDKGYNYYSTLVAALGDAEVEKVSNKLLELAKKNVPSFNPPA